MDHEKPTGPRNSPLSGSEGELAQDPTLDDFFRRLKQDLHQPKPGNESIAAALQAVQRLTSQVDADASASAAAEAAETRACIACGSQNPLENRFCAICGVPQQDTPTFAPEVPTAARPKPSAPAAGNTTTTIIIIITIFLRLMEVHLSAPSSGPQALPLHVTFGPAHHCRELR